MQLWTSVRIDIITSVLHIRIQVVALLLWIWVRTYLSQNSKIKW